MAHLYRSVRQQYINDRIPPPLVTTGIPIRRRRSGYTLKHTALCTSHTPGTELGDFIKRATPRAQ